ncbi:hypothetical protein MNBD_GAMMA06-1141 [hydrothermal vent metagenome]|uniref:Uncharacterized protein n=1 Tax=hydrothermal vent metagenome TaxID=652676 RepID=A0A3B0WPG1_9ZZZZ
MRLVFLEKYTSREDRPLSDVPISVIIFLVFALLLQLIWHNMQAPMLANAEDLTPPFSTQTYVLSSLAEPIAVSKILNLWLQAFDNQPGISLSFHQLNYPLLTKWLDTILALDPEGQYPMLVATNVYGSINDPVKQRIMTEYVFTKFNQQPNKYWRWLAHAVITARHEIKDNALALKYADALAEKATGKNVPYWAKDMKIIALEDMGEIEAAKVLVGALLESKQITDPYELNFLTNKIATLEEKAFKKRQSVEK